MATAVSDGQTPLVPFRAPYRPWCTRARYAQRAGPLQHRFRLGRGDAGIEEIAARQLL